MNEWSIGKRGNEEEENVNKTCWCRGELIMVEEQEREGEGRLARRGGRAGNSASGPKAENRELEDGLRRDENK